MSSVCIVTGGAGFIGLNLVEKLLQSGAEVVVIDNLSIGSNLPALSKLLRNYSNSQLQFIKASILESNLSDLLESGERAGRYFDLYHLAAVSHVDRSIGSPLDCVVHNVLGTACVLEAHRRFSKISKMCVVSTDEVYGDEGPFPSALGSPLRASSPYAASKASADLLVKAYRRTYDLPVKISRCCNNFGQYQHHEKFIPTVLKCVKDNTPVPVYGTGKQTRQWVPVQIHADRLIEFMREAHLDQHIGGYSLTNMSLIQEIAAIRGEAVRWNRVADRPGHDLKYELQDSKSIDKAEFIKHLKQYVIDELGLDAGIKPALS